MASFEESPGVHSPGGHLRAFLFVSAGVLLGVLLTLCAGYAALRSGAVQNYLRSYFTSALLSQSSSQAVSPGALDTKIPLQSLVASTTVHVPKAYGTLAYHTAINAIIFDYNTTVKTLNTLQPLLVEINANASSGRYEGILDRLLEAKILISRQKAVAGETAQHLVALSTAHQGIPDAVTRSLTQTFITNGNTLYTDLTAYIATLEVFFSGKPPGTAEVEIMLTQLKKTSDSIQIFRSSMQPILDHFKEYTDKRAS